MACFGLPPDGFGHIKIIVEALTMNPLSHTLGDFCRVTHS